MHLFYVLSQLGDRSGVFALRLSSVELLCEFTVTNYTEVFTTFWSWSSLTASLEFVNELPKNLFEERKVM